MKKDDVSKVLAIVALIFLMVCGFIENKYRAKISEATKLPYHSVKLEEVEDGIYPGKTYTSYAHLQLNVKVESHKITDIEIVECDGLEVVKAKNVVQQMIDQNKIVIPAKKGEELGTMIFISCVDSALYGLEEENINQK